MPDLIELPQPLPPGTFTEAQKDLIKQTIAKGSSDLELALFLEVCKKRGLDPFAKQIYCIQRWDESLGRTTSVHLVAIDGFRLQAQRSHEYQGQTKVEWCDQNGKWGEVWLKGKIPPVAARVGVHRKDFKEPLYAVAHYEEFVQRYKDKQGQWRPAGQWGKMPANQISKCAEAAALRKAFPEELSGFYAPEELERYDRDGRAAETDVPEPSEPYSQDTKPHRTAEQIKIFEYFGPMKKELGATDYYDVLWDFNKKHCDEIQTLEEGRPIYKAMQARLKQRDDEKRQAAQQQPEAPHHDTGNADDTFDDPNQPDAL